jgi:hypothetical protein
MNSAKTLDVRMREDELVAQLRYHEDRLREAERIAAFHRAAADIAGNELARLQRAPEGPEPRLSAA